MSRRLNMTAAITTSVAAASSTATPVHQTPSMIAEYRVSSDGGHLMVQLGMA